MAVALFLRHRIHKVASDVVTRLPARSEDWQCLQEHKEAYWSTRTSNVPASRIPLPIDAGRTVPRYSSPSHRGRCGGIRTPWGRYIRTPHCRQYQLLADHSMETAATSSGKQGGGLAAARLALTRPSPRQQSRSPNATSTSPHSGPPRPTPETHHRPSSSSLLPLVTPKPR